MAYIVRYWFKTNEIRDQNNLNEKEVAYLKRCTFKQFIPFWLLFRRQWDIFLLIKFIGPMLFFMGYFSNSLIYKILLIAFGILIPIVFIFIGIRYGRLLAWNRKTWHNFQSYKNSERRWATFGLLGLALLIFLKFLYPFFDQVVDPEHIPQFRSEEAIQI